MSQMIVGMIDVPINNNQHASMDEDVDNRVHVVWETIKVGFHICYLHPVLWLIFCSPTSMKWLNWCDVDMFDFDHLSFV